MSTPNPKNNNHNVKSPIKPNPAPNSVRTDRVLFALMVLVASSGVILYRALDERHHRDWTAVEQDSVFMETLQGILMGWQTNQNMTTFLTQSRINHWGQGKHYLVTGGNRGLGRAIAIRLLALGADVTITARSADANLPSQLEKEAANLWWPGSDTPKTSTIGKASVVAMDLADLHSVTRAAQAIAGLIPDLHVAILNAGVVPPPNAEVTKQEIEIGVGVNAMGHYHLIQELQNKHGLLNGDGRNHQRIVAVTSETHRSAPPLKIDGSLIEPVERTVSDAMNYYARSKLVLTTLFSRMARLHRNDKLSVHIICPGPVATDIARGAAGIFQPLVSGVMSLIFQSSDRGAWPVLMLAVDPQFEMMPSQYYHMYEPKAQRKDTVDPDIGDRLARFIEQTIKAKMAKGGGGGGGGK